MEAKRSVGEDNQESGSIKETPPKDQQGKDKNPEDKMCEKPNEEPKKKRKRRPPLVPWKKPKDMPRRPLSAYNIFFKEQRELMMNAAASGSTDQSAATKRKSNKSVGIGFANLARTIAANWKDLDDETRAPYEARAASEKDRYNREMLVWRAKQKEEKERAAAAEQKPGVDQSVGGVARMDVDTEAHLGGQRSSPMIVTSAHDDEPLPLESPKKTQRYLGHHGRQDSAFTPIRLPDLMGTRMEPMQYPSHQPGLLDTIHAPFGMAGGQGMIPQGYPGIPPGGFPSFHDSWPNIGMGSHFGQEPHHAAAPAHPTPHFHQERRYTWSGSNSGPGKHQALRRNTNERESDIGFSPPSSNPFPESWFEPDSHPNPAPRSMQGRSNRSKTYPDNWFEVQDAEGPTEPIRYSPEGDITGKLPGRQQARRSQPLFDSSGKLGKSVSKAKNEGKEKHRESGIRSLDEFSSDVTMRAAKPTRESPTENPIVESSLHALGMQLDAETVDFLTKLKFGMAAEQHKK